MSGYEPTSQQSAVVAHPLEPLRVAAGAGTGKTATVVARLIGMIDSGVPPEAALGITFTNKAAEELADRLRFALPDLAREGREVEVTTYHGFAYRLLQEFGALVGVERDADVIGPGYVRQLLFECLVGGDYSHLDLSAAAQRVADAAALAARLGDNLRRAADVLSLECEDGDPTILERRELASIIHRYEQTKRDLGVVDYADLIYYSHRLVADHSLVAQRVRDRYRCVVLDEYQDTAPAQRELLRLLFADGFPVTAVGDADQTIYEWRGASPANFAAFPTHFPVGSGSEATTLPLSINHRSGSAILDVAHAVRARIHDKGSFLRLEPGPGAPRGDVEARWFRTAVDEATWVADEVKRLHDEDGVAWSDMAVLFRKNRQIGLVRDACALVGVPVEVASLGGLLDVPEVADLVAWLRLLHHRDDTISLARILLGSRYRLGFGDLAPIAAWARSQGLWRDHDEGPSWPLLEAVDRVGEISGLSEEPRRRLIDFRDRYRELLTAAQGLSLIELCRTILEVLNAWDEIEAMEPAAAASTRLNLYRFLDLAQGWSPLRGRPSLEGFLGYLEMLSDDPAAEELDTARIGGTDAVALLTVHRAKGLEWDTVFLPALASGIFPARPLGYDDPESNARDLPYELRLEFAAVQDGRAPGHDPDETKRERHAAGEWRTAYVAVTRARLRLYLSGAYWYGGRRARRPSDLFEVATTCPSVHHILSTTDPGERPERLATADTAHAPDPLFPEGWRQALRETLDDPTWPRRLVRDTDAYDDTVDQLRLVVDGLPQPGDADADTVPPALSVTGLVTLAACPLRFYWSEIDRLPRRPAAALRRGIEVHRRIELHNRGAISFDDLDDDLYDVPAGGGAADGEAARTRGRDGFAVFLESRFAGRSPRFIETPIDLKVGDARVRGRIDAVYEGDDGSWEIVDYKSGRPRADDAGLVQLEAYALAAREGAIGSDPPDELRATFLYLGGPEPEEVSVKVDEPWLADASRRLHELVDRAGGDEFPASPSPACAHCDFLRFCDAGRDFLDDAS